MKIVDAEKLTPLLESIKKAIYFEDAGATRNRILSCLSDIAALATDNPWEAAARKLAGLLNKHFDIISDVEDGLLEKMCIEGNGKP